MYALRSFSLNCNMALGRLVGALVLVLLAASNASEDANSSRTGRQWTYAEKPVYQPTVQYFHIDKVQNGPASSEAGLLPRTWEKYFMPYYSPLGLYGPSDAVTTAGNEEDPSFRQLNLFGGLFNNRFSNGNTNLNTFRPIQDRVPILVRNPDAASLYGSCEASGGEMGICIPNVACNLYGGRNAGSCRFGSVCCVNTVTRCAATVTLNNTYFQSPSTQTTTPNSCTLTVKLDSSLVEQKQAICQVRLDFLSFSISQPDNVGATTRSQCLTDSFQVGGARNSVPTICGDNDGQHMYIHVPPSNTDPTDVRLTFNFGAATFTRSWNIRIAMLPCNSPSLAPAGCLQYMTMSSGRIFSFNWKDVAVSATRQLANQNYKVCFRTEMVDRRRADTMCFTQCTAPNSNAFLLSGALGDDSASGPTDCPTDFIAVNAVVDAARAAFGYDRFCGEFLNPDATGESEAAPVCTSARPFELLYVTNDNEANDDNVGFCLNFQQTAA